MGCTDMKMIVFGPKCRVKKLGEIAFWQCEALEEVNLQDSLEEIDANVFDGCSNLQKVTFGRNLKIVGENAFFDCTKIETIVLKEGVTTIGDCAFHGCESLSTFVWPESITTVGDKVFKDCAKLHELVGAHKQDDVIANLKSMWTLIRLCVFDGKLKEMKQVVEGDPDALKQKHGDSRTLLSYYCESGTSEATLKWLLETYPDAAKEKDNFNSTPLNNLCFNSSLSTFALIKSVAEANLRRQTYDVKRAPSAWDVPDRLFKSLPDTERNAPHPARRTPPPREGKKGGRRGGRRGQEGE